jgi:hypothetical protein
MTLRTASLALAAALALPARAGVVLEGAEDGGKSTVHVEGSRLRVEGTDGVMIFDADTKTLFQIDPARKNYREMNEADMKAMRAELDRAMEQMPPEVRAQVQARLGSPAKGPPPKPRWERTGRTEEAMGRRCEVYRAVVEGKATGEACVVPFEALDVQRSDFRVFEALAEFTRSFAGAGAQGGAGGVEWREVPGMPVVTWSLDERGERREDFRATRVQRASVPPDRFRPPAGFEKIPTR